MHFCIPTVLLALSLPFAAMADEFTTHLEAAEAAYLAGDLKDAATEIGAASTFLGKVKSDLLNALMPAAPDGWTQTINTEYAATLAMAGGGTGAEARYDGPDGQSVTVGVVMESPLTAMMMSMFGNAQMLAMMGKTVEVGGTTLLDQDNSLVTVLDQRIMVTFNGASTAQLLPFAEALDFEALANFDSPK